MKINYEEIKTVAGGIVNDVIIFLSSNGVGIIKDDDFVNEAICNYYDVSCTMRGMTKDEKYNHVFSHMLKYISKFYSSSLRVNSSIDIENDIHLSYEIEDLLMTRLSVKKVVPAYEVVRIIKIR